MAVHAPCRHARQVSAAGLTSLLPQGNLLASRPWPALTCRYHVHGHTNAIKNMLVAHMLGWILLAHDWGQACQQACSPHGWVTCQQLMNQAPHRPDIHLAIVA